MTSNSIGRIFRLTTYGESHGPGVGGVVDGCPAGLELAEEDLQAALNQRRPGALGKGGKASTARSEKDRVRILSGLFEGKTTGTPIAFHVENTDVISKDYAELSQILRPGHADLPFLIKYGIRDYRGGGRASGRETLSRVAGGAIAARFLRTQGISLQACTLELGGITAPLTDIAGAQDRPWFSPDDNAVAAWDAMALSARNEGDTLGGRVRVEVHGLPAGIGEPVFDKLDARLAYAFMGVGTVKGVYFGKGAEMPHMWGSDSNDAILPGAAAMEEKVIAAAGTLPGGAGYAFASNNMGGVLGGMSSGAPVVVTAAIKPISSIGREQRTITDSGEARLIRIRGRHDVSSIPRIVPVLKAMAALSVADLLLLHRAARAEGGW
ncbi:MAG: chorismate synthase [Desulfovibrio sp.]|nr:chorismate synthase [Desulfovibrio sp.]